MTPILHSRYFVLPVSAAILGTLIGAVRGSRRASLRFLAENAHRPPTTVQGWYFYNKTKNYRQMAAGLQEGGLNATKLGAAALVWVGIEDGLEQCGKPWIEARELGAGVGTAGIFAVVCTWSRFPQWRILMPTLAGCSRPASVAHWSSGRVSRRRGGRRDGVAPMGEIVLGDCSGRVVDMSLKKTEERYSGRSTLRNVRCCHSWCITNTCSSLLLTVVPVPRKGDDQALAVRARAAHPSRHRRRPRAPKPFRCP